METNLDSDNNNRLSWDEYFMSIAILASKRSSCSRLNVGCIIIKDNRIVTTGYNGFLRGAPHISRVLNNHEQATVHAEQNAICDAAFRGVNISNSVAYITHYPCLTCFKLLVASGINTIKYLNDYKNDPLVKELADENNIQIIHL
jgi:dCMP deaminase